MSKIGDVHRRPAILPVLITCMVLLFVLTASAFSAPLWHHVTVVSTEGWRFDDVTVVLADSSDSLIVHHADATKSRMAFGDIESIQNIRGENITALVLDRTVEKAENFVPEEEPVAPTERISRGYRFNSAFSVMSGFSTLTGKRYSHLRGDLGFEIAARIRLYKRAYIGLVYIHQRIQNQDRVEYDKSTGGWCVLQDDYIQHEMYCIVGSNSWPRSFTQAFLMYEVGAGCMWDDADYESASPWVYSPGRGSETYVSARFSMAVVVPVNRVYGLMVGIHNRITGGWWDDEIGIGALIGVHVGLVFMTGS